MPKSRIKRGSADRISTPKITLPLKRDDEVVFSFKYLHKVSFDKTKRSDFFVKFILRLQSLSSLGWDEINRSDRHQYGWEKIPAACLHPTITKSPIPDINDLICFRASGDNRVFLGVRLSNVFYILFIEAEFGDIYDNN